MKEQRLAYPESVVQAIGQYLMTKPYQEVAPLIQALQARAVKVETDVEVSDDGSNVS